MKINQKPPRESSGTSAIESSATNSKWILAIAAISLVFIAVSLYVRKGGWLHGEADCFLVDHLSDRPFLSKILCPHAHDADLYQARELSHLIEHVDAWFIYLCCELQVPHFYSVMTFVFLFIIVMMQWHYSTRLLHFDRWCQLFLLVAFWASPCIFLSGNYVRTAKQAASFVLFFLVWHTYKHLIQLSTKPGWRLGIELFLMNLALCWLDRQGFFFAIGFFLSVVATGYWAGLNRWKIAASASLAAVLSHSLYNSVIGPAVIKSVVGHPVSHSYQKLPWEDLRANFWKLVADGISLIGDTLGYFLGNITATLAFCVLFFVAWMVYKSPLPGRSPEHSSAPRLPWPKVFAGTLVGWVLLLAGMNVLMVLRHAPLTWPDSRRMDYYWIPAAVMILTLSTFALAYLAKAKLLNLKWARLILAAMALSNVFALNSHLKISQQGYAAGQVIVAPHLLNAIRSLYQNSPTPNLPDRPPYNTAQSFLCVRFDQMLQNPIIQLNTTGKINMEEYLRTSHFYNFLRWKVGQDFVQPPP